MWEMMRILEMRSPFSHPALTGYLLALMDWATGLINMATFALALREWVREEARLSLEYPWFAASLPTYATCTYIVLRSN